MSIKAVKYCFDGEVEMHVFVDCELGPLHVPLASEIFTPNTIFQI